MVVQKPAGHVTVGLVQTDLGPILRLKCFHFPYLGPLGEEIRSGYCSKSATTKYIFFAKVWSNALSTLHYPYLSPVCLKMFCPKMAKYTTQLEVYLCTIIALRNLILWFEVCVGNIVMTGNHICLFLWVGYVPEWLNNRKNCVWQLIESTCNFSHNQN